MDGQSPQVAEPVYKLIRLGGSPLAFRAQPEVEGRADCAVLGSDMSFGRFVTSPWPQELAQAAGISLRNLAVPQTGPEAWLADDVLMGLAVRARMQLVELPGCQRLSNRYYQVHPRRNDRVVQISASLQALYPELDFADYIFVGHLLRSLKSTCCDRFQRVAAALRQAWLDRMGALLGDLPGPVVLLWLRPQAGTQQEERVPLTADLVQVLQHRVRATLEVPYGPVAVSGGLAACFPDAKTHEEIARQLLPLLPPL